MRITRPLALSVNWLCSESLPLTNGVPKASAASRHASHARTSVPIASAESVPGQQKLSSRASRFRSAPTQTALRIASSIAAIAMSYGSRICGARPQEIATPRRPSSLGRMTAASPGPSCSGPTNGLITLPPRTSWSYRRTMPCLDRTFGSASVARSISAKPALRLERRDRVDASKATFCSSGELPASSGEFPASSGEVPASSGEVPASSGEAPGWFGELPVSLGNVPASFGAVPAARGDDPDWPEARAAACGAGGKVAGAVRVARRVGIGMPSCSRPMARRPTSWPS